MTAKRILIVEDEPLIAMMLEDFLESLGHKVHAHCETLGDAIEVIEGGGFDGAVLDVNLRGEHVWPAAKLMREKSLPFLIASGGHVDEPPAEFAAVPMLDKPFTIHRVEGAVQKLFAAE